MDYTITTLEVIILYLLLQNNKETQYPEILNNPIVYSS